MTVGAARGRALNCKHSDSADIWLTISGCTFRALFTGLALEELAQRCQEALARSPELGESLKGPPNVAVWTGGRGWFAVEGQRLGPCRLAAPRELEHVVAAMSRELVDYRLQMFRARSQTDGAGAAFTCTVLWNQRDPILELPCRSGAPQVPVGEIPVRLPDGAVWTFKLAKEFCNVACPAGTPKKPGGRWGWCSRCSEGSANARS